MSWEQNEVERISRMDSEYLLREYKDGVRHCFGRGWPAASVLQDIIAAELLKRGITHIPNIFGDIAINADWKQFQSNQRAAIASRGR